MLVRDRSVGLPPFGAWYHFGIKGAQALRRGRSRRVLSSSGVNGPLHQGSGSIPPRTSPWRHATLSNVVGVVYNTDMGILTVKGCYDDGKEKSTGCRGYDRTGR